MGCSCLICGWEELAFDMVRGSLQLAKRIVPDTTRQARKSARNTRRAEKHF